MILNQHPKATFKQRFIRWASVFASSMGIGAIMGLAWCEWIPPVLGIIGLAAFFFQQMFLNQLRFKILGALITGVVGYKIGSFWLPESISILAGLGDLKCQILSLVANLYQAIPFVAIALLLHYASRFRLGFLTAGCLWFLAEQLFPSFYPCHFGYLLTDSSEIAQLASIGGSALVSLFAAHLALLISLAPSCALTLTVDDRWSGDFKGKRIDQRLCGIGAILSILLVAFLWGRIRFNGVEETLANQTNKADGLDVLVVQCDTMNPSSHKRLVAAAEQVEGKADLVVWPEASIGSYNQGLVDFNDSTQVANNSAGTRVRGNPFPGGKTPLIAGGDSFQFVGRDVVEYVSAFLFDANQQCVGRHDKIELMPAGEYIPLSSYFPAIRKLFGTERVISCGEEAKSIGMVNGVRLATVLCCEDMYPGIFRQMVADEADLLISIGNGMAFRSEVPLKQHFRIAKLRAIENGKFLIRGTSHGVSALVSPSGSVVNSLPCHKQNAMLVRVPKIQLEPTGFGRLGVAIPWALCFVGLVVALVASRKSKNE